MMDKAKSTPVAAPVKKEKPVEKEIAPIEIKEKSQPVPVPMKKKAGKKEDEPAKATNIGFGPLGALGGGTASSLPAEDQSANSNFF